MSSMTVTRVQALVRRRMVSAQPASILTTERKLSRPITYEWNINQESGEILQAILKKMLAS